MFMISITFALMSKQSAFDYKVLASYLLPKGILESFDVTAVNEDHTGIIKRQVMSVSFFTSILTKKMHEKKSGTTLSRMVLQKAVRLTTFLSVITRSFFISDVADG